MAGDDWTGGAGGPPFTMRTLPSASVISSSETFDSDTRSINVFIFRRSMVFAGSSWKVGEFTAKRCDFYFSSPNLRVLRLDAGPDGRAGRSAGSGNPRVTGSPIPTGRGRDGRACPFYAPG